MSIVYEKFDPTEYVIAVRNGKVVKKGLGLSLFYNTMSTSVMVVPATAINNGFTFNDIMTADFQEVNVQGDISCVISDYEQAAKMLNFTYSRKKSEYSAIQSEARQFLAKSVMNIVKVYVVKYISGRRIQDAIVSNDELAKVLREGMKSDDTLKGLGIEIISIAILGITAKPETQRALEAATREEILKQQDDAIYKRRNSAIEQERIVKENELNTEIKIAEKQKEKQEQQMETKRIMQERQAELDAKKLANNIELEEDRAKLVELQTDNEKKKSDAKAYDSEVLLRTFKNIDIEVIKALATSGMDSKALIAKAFVDIGDKADKIGTLNVSPDLLETLMDK